MDNYGQIIGKITGSIWLMTPEALTDLLNIVDRRLDGVKLSDEELNAVKQGSPDREELEIPDKPSVAVLPIHGSLFGKGNLLTKMSGASSIEKMRADFKTLLNSDKVTSIVLDIDSPGGSSDLIAEFGDDIYAARGIKPVTAIANTMCGSAALWLGSQAEHFYATKSAKIGSVGAYTVHTDNSGALEKEGVKKTFISAGRFKVAGNPFEPLSEDARAYAQDSINQLADDFHEALARGRGISKEVVAQTYGEGKMFRAKVAKEIGMIDEVKTLDEVVGELTSADKNAPNEMEKVMDGITPEMLEALGLGEDATIEEINAAVVSLASDNTQLTSELAPLKAATEKAKAFAEQFPEEANRIKQLEERDRIQSAQLFSQDYEMFDSGKGFSGAALQTIQNMHLKTVDRSLTVDDLKSFLDSISEGSAIVDYKEHGSNRSSALNEEAATSQNAGTELVRLAQAAIEEAGGADQLSYGDALAKVSKENPELVEMYNSATGRGGDK